jgi:hypothetical protein
VQHVEVVVGHYHAIDPLGPVGRGQVPATAEKHAHAVEGPILPTPLAEVGVSDECGFQAPLGRPLIEVHQPLLLRHREGSEIQLVDHREDHHAATHADRQDSRDHHREPRAPAQRPNRVA